MARCKCYQSCLFHANIFTYTSQNTLLYTIFKSREQIDIEHVIRRRYDRKWGDVTLDNRIKLYSHHNANEQMKKIPSQKAPLPYEYTGHGQSYFLSKDMYDSLMTVCRCGRPKTDGHILKCLQKEVSSSDGSATVSTNHSDKKQTPATPNGSFLILLI